MSTPAYRAYNAARQRAYRDRLKNDPVRYAEFKRKRREHQTTYLYGLPFEQYEKMLEGQGGVCAICGSPPSLLRRNERRLSVDHDHRTNAIRGLLCQKCNRAIGLLGDDAGVIRKAAAYLEAC